MMVISVCLKALAKAGSVGNVNIVEDILKDIKFW